MQLFLVYVIVAVAAIFSVRKVYRTIKRPSKHFGCPCCDGHKCEATGVQPDSTPQECCKSAECCGCNHAEAETE